MHIIQEEIGPPKIVSGPAPGSKAGDDNHLLFTISPLPPGYGITLGNALRRVLYSSLPGAAVTSVRIEGASHEYSAIKGVLESVLDLGLNARKLAIKKFHKDPEVITLEGKGPATLTAKDIEASSDIEILNPSLKIANLEKGANLKMSLTVEKGVGYTSAAARNHKESEPGLIFVDSVFSPVRRVKYDIQSTRVGDRTNLDKLQIEIETNGSLNARDAMKFAAQLLNSYFNYFSLDEEQIEKEFFADFTRAAAKTEEEQIQQTKESYTPIEILNFSPRTLNALINGGIGSIEQLTKCSHATLTNLRGFGSKALDEVADVLQERNLKLSDNGSAPDISIPDDTNLTDDTSTPSEESTPPTLAA